LAEGSPLANTQKIVKKQYQIRYLTAIQKPEIIGKQSEKPKKQQQCTDMKRIANSKIQARWGPSCYISFGRGAVRFAPLPPVSYATDHVHFKHKHPQVLLIESHVTIGTIQQTQDTASVLGVYRHNRWHAA